MLRILLIGKGGREHALAWKLNKSSRVEHVYVVPGNGGTAHGLAKVSNIDSTRADDYPALIRLATCLNIGLVIAGSDQAVVDGIEGFCREVLSLVSSKDMNKNLTKHTASIPCFAPTKSSAIIEGSKTWAKDFMRRHGIPTAAYGNFSNYEQAKSYLATVKYPVVIKASGLAAGKGVIIAENSLEADEALGDMLIRSKFGSAGTSVVIEEYLNGAEISILTFSDGITTRTMPSSQDHKRIFDDDRGPNTGGMGVFAPTPRATPEVMKRIEHEILQPTFEGLKSEGLTYTGMLFTGLMLTDSGPKVLEYNARFGDPETQSVLLLLDEDTDLAEIMMACIEKRLNEVCTTTKAGFACNVVVAAGGYPGSYSQGDPIRLGPIPEEVILFHAGTSLLDEQLVTAGGRVFSVAATGATLEMAIDRAYEGVKSIEFTKMFYRKDIGQRVLRYQSIDRSRVP